MGACSWLEHTRHLQAVRYNGIRLNYWKVTMSGIIKELGDGLILRRSRAEDAEALVAFNHKIHAEGEWDGKGLDAWTRDLISGKQPNFGVDDFTIVEDTKDHKLVSSMNLISQIWTYEGVPFGVGRPELVGTLPEYRRRGLVREQFDLVHQWSAERGELVQVITGIPDYYRQFGYEMALNLGGGRMGYAPGVTALKDDEEELYHLRTALETDLALIAELYELGCKRSPIAAKWGMTLWRHELSGKDRHNINMRLLYIIEDNKNEPVGFVAVPPIKWGNSTVITAYELKAGVSWVKVTPNVVRWLWQFGEEQAKEQDQKHERFGLSLGEEHPAYRVYGEHMPRKRKPYAWYMRVPDLAKFILKIAPALEVRLEQSLLNEYDGTLKLNFFRSGLRMTFESGKIIGVENLGTDTLKDCGAEFPGLSFLQILFGRRSLDEVRYYVADCSVRNDEARVLLETLFPRKPSNVWGIS